MKFYLLSFFSFLFFSSCQTYQYMTVDSKSVKRDSAHQFVVENDTLLLQYNFNGYNGPVKVTVFNKSDHPVYIDWKKSAVIVQGKAYSYYSPNLQLDGSVTANQLNTGGGVRTSVGSVSGEIRAQEGVDFLPPKSMKERSSLYLLNGFYDLFQEDAMVKQHPDNDPLLPRVKMISYNEESSPFRLRSYLTFYTSEPDSKLFAMEHEFFVSSIGISVNGPDNLPSYRTRGDRFYTSKISGFGKGAGAVAGVGILAGLVVVAAANGDR